MSGQSQRDEARSLLDLLTKDVDTNTLGEKKVADALTQLKVLGRNVDNVSSIYNEEGIQILGRYAFGDYSSSISQEALRCIANALLLLPATRQHSIKLSLDKKVTDALREANEDEEFLLSRILFLLTYDPGIKMDDLIAEHDLAGSITKHLSRHAGKPTKSNQGNMALMETLKLLFNATSIKIEQAAKFNPAVVEILRILNLSDIPSPPLQPPISLLVNALANLEIDAEQIRTPGIEPALDKLIAVLDKAVQAHPSSELDTVAVPLLTVLRHTNAVAPPELRERLKTQILPDDKERDQPLGKSSSLASRLLRLTTNSGMLNLAEAISGLMFELSDKDANEYVKNVGYGYAAGYLMTHKIPIPESAKTSQGTGESSSQVPVNPITGQRLDKEPGIEMPEMTQEEKEREAERLFVLFNRLNATGVVNVKNPVELAKEQGRFEELSDSDPDE